MAQLGSVPRSGRGGRGFESRHPDARSRRSRSQNTRTGPSCVASRSCLRAEGPLPHVACGEGRFPRMPCGHGPLQLPTASRGLNAGTPPHRTRAGSPRRSQGGDPGPSVSARGVGTGRKRGWRGRLSTTGGGCGQLAAGVPNVAFESLSVPDAALGTPESRDTPERGRQRVARSSVQHWAKSPSPERAHDHAERAAEASWSRSGVVAVSSAVTRRASTDVASARYVASAR